MGPEDFPLTAFNDTPTPRVHEQQQPTPAMTIRKELLLAMMQANNNSNNESLDFQYMNQRRRNLSQVLMKEEMNV